MSENELSLWPSKVLKLQIQDAVLCQSLARLAINHRLNLGSLTPENHCIWNWPYEEIKILKTQMIEAYEAWARLYGHEINLKDDPLRDLYLQHAWAQVYDAGGGANIHSHQLADATAVFYVTDHSSQASEGPLVLHDPRWVSDEMLYVEKESTTFQVNPSEGLLVVFPGYLWHSVPPFLGKNQRVCYVTTLEYSLVRRAQSRAHPRVDSHV
jgi:hypothetical protein